jgi:cell division protein FtsL
VKHATRFVGLWTLAVVATASAFILYLALRSRAVELGYKLGRARAKQAQLRETRRVLQVEAVAYRNPERVGALAKGVLQLEEPPPQRIFVVGAPIEATESVKPSPSVAPKPSASAIPSGAAPVPSIDLVPAVDLEGPAVFGKPGAP